jgi:transposase
MSKYSSEFKLEVVKYYLENNVGYQPTADHFGVAYSPVVRWVRKYKENGYTGLMKNQKTSYSGDFKQYVVEYMHNNHFSANETAIQFNLAGDYIVNKWERIYYEEGPQALCEERRGRSKNMSSKPRKNKNVNENEDLLEEVQRLRMENEYLKKLNALVQERIKRENKKK